MRGQRIMCLVTPFLNLWQQPSEGQAHHWFPTHLGFTKQMWPDDNGPELQILREADEINGDPKVGLKKWEQTEENGRIGRREAKRQEFEHPIDGAWTPTLHFSLGKPSSLHTLFCSLSRKLIWTHSSLPMVPHGTTIIRSDEQCFAEM